MPEGTYNAFSKTGQVVEDPRHVAWLEGNDEKLGGDLRGTGAQDAAGYLLHRTKGVTLGDLSAYYEEHGHPTICLETEGEEQVKRFVWDDQEEQYEPRE